MIICLMQHFKNVKMEELYVQLYTYTVFVNNSLIENEAVSLILD